MPATPASTSASATGTAARHPAHDFAAGLRGCLSRFTTGVTVVSFDACGDRYGVTVNAFTAVSMDPPLVLVSIARLARAHDPLHGNPFCVNVLGAEQESLAHHFAGRSDARIEWVEGPTAPRLSGTLAYLECGPWTAYDGGDHTLFLGRVTGFDYRCGATLAYANSRFNTLVEPAVGHEHLM